MRLPVRLGFIILFLSVGLPISASGEVSDIERKAETELKRTAHRLKIPAEQLKNAREALREATDLVENIDPYLYPSSIIYNLASGWIRAHPLKAESEIDSLIADVQHRMITTDDPEFYEQAVETFGFLLTSLKNINPEKALNLARNFPDLPESLNEQAETYDVLKSSTISVLLMDTAGIAPELVMEQLEQLKELNRRNAFRQYIYTNLIEAFSEAGRRDKVREVVDQAMNYFSRKRNDPSALHDFNNFLLFSGDYIDPDQAGTALNSLIRMMRDAPALNRSSWTVTRGNQIINVNYIEHTLLGIFRQFKSKPRLIIDTLDRFPDLKTKLEVFGGIDNFLDLPLNASFGFNEPEEGLNRQLPLLKKEASSNPDFVERELRNYCDEPEDAQILINLASKSAYEHPEFAEIALKVSEDRLNRIIPYSERTLIFENLIIVHRKLYGEVSEELISQGFITANLTRTELRDKSGRFGSGAQRAAESGEARLISELAREDYGKTIRYVRSLESDRIKLECLIYIAESLSLN